AAQDDVDNSSNYHRGPAELSDQSDEFSHEAGTSSDHPRSAKLPLAYFLSCLTKPDRSYFRTVLPLTSSEGRLTSSPILWSFAMRRSTVRVLTAIRLARADGRGYGSSSNFHH